jgi:uncharacterized protein (TIGR01244 family)
MQPTKINDKLSVSKQPERADFPALARQGFKAVINNRPDGEDAAQPGSAAEQQAAERAGMGYTHIPVSLETITEGDVRHFQSALSAAPGPVFAHCKSGTRSLSLWIIGEVLDGRMRRAEVISFGQAHGYDLKAADAWLAHHGKGPDQ